jgi:5-methylcytosine-specific restriction endonuclease McrA
LSGEPYPKGKQLARGERRYRRKVASPKAWQSIIAAKQGPCRVCCHPNGNGHGLGLVQFHHLIPRVHGGDDVPDNIVPLHAACHSAVTSRAPGALQSVSRSLTDAEYAYVIGKLGEGALARLFGVTT